MKTKAQTCLALLLCLLIVDLFSRQAGAEKRMPDNPQRTSSHVRARILVQFHTNIGRDHARQIIAACLLFGFAFYHQVEYEAHRGRSSYNSVQSL